MSLNSGDLNQNDKRRRSTTDTSRLKRARKVPPERSSITAPPPATTFLSTPLPTPMPPSSRLSQLSDQHQFVISIPSTHSTMPPLTPLTPLTTSPFLPPPTRTTTTTTTTTPVRIPPPTTTTTPGLVGGDNPIIITAPPSTGGTTRSTSKGRSSSTSSAPPTAPRRPDIALLTAEADTQAEVESDYLYQALRKIRDSPIFSALLDDVTKHAPGDWRTLAASQLSLDPAERSMPEEVLNRMARLDPSVGIVIVDSDGFADMGDPPVAYNSTTHVIEHAKPTAKQAPYPLTKGGGYWAYLRGVVFELCNASQRPILQEIDRQAELGELDAISFTLAKEVLETTSEEMHDGLMKRVLKDGSFSRTRDEGATTTTDLPLPTTKKMLYGGISAKRAERLRNSIKMGHALGYLEVWKRDFADTYKGKHSTEFDQLTAWTTSTSSTVKPPGADYVKTLSTLGLTTSKAEVSLIEDHTRQAYDDPDAFNPDAGQSDDEDYSEKPRSRKKTAKKKVRKTSKSSTRGSATPTPRKNSASSSGSK